MAGSDRDLVLALRAELAGIDPARECDREAERAGLEGPARWRDASLARLGVRLARHEDGPEGSSPAPPPPFDWATRPDHCRMAWLRGLFLARGSLSLANGRTHLELVVAPEEAPVTRGTARRSGRAARAGASAEVEAS